MSAAFHAFGFGIWHGHPDVDATPRRHNELELVLVDRGAATMQIGMQFAALRTGALAAFWAMAPHHVTQALPTALLYRVTVPISDVLQWHLPQALTHHILAGKIVTEERSRSMQFDRALFQKWRQDFSDATEEGLKILRLEIEARLRRMMRSATSEGTETDETAGAGELNHAMSMGRYIAEHYTEPVHDSDVARAVRLNAQYASRVFSKVFGVGIHRHLNDYRIAHACCLLRTTNRKVIDIALESGFGSPSRFYENFTRACGQRPNEYRMALM